MDKLTKGREGRRDGRFPGVTGGVCKKRGWAAFAEGACPGRDKGFPHTPAFLIMLASRWGHGGRQADKRELAG